MYSLRNHHQIKIMNRPITLKGFLMPLCNSSFLPSLPSPGNHWSAFCQYRLVCIFYNFSINGIIQYVLLFVWLFSFNIVIFGFIHVMCINSLFFSLLNSIPFYGYVTISLSTLLLRDIWIVSSLELLQTKLHWTFAYKSLHEHMLSFLLAEYLEVEWLCQMVGIYLIFKKLPGLPKWLYHFTFPLAMYESSSWSISLLILSMVSLLF